MGQGNHESNDFLIARHAQFATDEHVVFDLVRTSTRKSPNSCTRVVRGNDNEVYIVDTEEGLKFVVRIKRFGELSLAQEAWAIELCRNAGVRVPEVMFVGTVDSGSESLEVMVQSIIPGKPLSDVAASFSHDMLKTALYQAGEELARLNSIEVQGFYQYDLVHGWDFKNWVEISASMVRDRLQEGDLILQNQFTRQDFLRMVQFLEFYRENHHYDQPVFCHGDYIPAHIFFDENARLTGIIDFGMFQGGPRVHDLAIYNLNRPEQELNLLLDGYWNVYEREPGFESQLKLHTLVLAMGFLAHETRIGDTESARSTAERLRETLLWCEHHL